MVLKVTKGHFFQLSMACVSDTNSRADLLALWGIFLFAWKWNFFSSGGGFTSCHRISGKRSCLQVIILEGQNLRICELQ